MLTSYFVTCEFKNHDLSKKLFLIVKPMISALHVPRALCLTVIVFSFLASVSTKSRRNFLPTLTSVLGRPSALAYAQQTSKEDDDGPSSVFELGRTIKSKIQQILFGRSSNRDDDLNDDYEQEKEDGEEKDGVFQFLRKSARGDDRDGERGDVDDYFKRKFGQDEEEDDDYYNSQLRSKFISKNLLEAYDKDEIDNDDKNEDGNDSDKSEFGSSNRNRYFWWNDGNDGYRSNRGDSPFTGDDEDNYRDDKDDENDDKEGNSGDKDYSTNGPRFTTKFLMTKGKKYRFEDLLDSGLDDDDDNGILEDFGDIFEEKFYGLFEYVDDILDDVFDDDFDDFYNDLFDDDGFDDIFAPKYAHYFKDSDDDIDDRYEDFDDFFENYSKMSSMMDEGKFSEEDDQEDDKSNAIDDDKGDGAGDGDDDGDDSTNQPGVWSIQSRFDVHRNGYGDDREDEVDEKDKRLFDFASTLKGAVKSKVSRRVDDIESILERFYDN